MLILTRIVQSILIVVSIFGIFVLFDTVQEMLERRV